MRRALFGGFAMRSWIKKYKTLVLVVSGLCIYCTLLAHSKKDTRPADDSDFITFEYSGVELEVCPCCSGVWFDAGELPRIARRPDIDPREFTVVNLLLLPDKCMDEKYRNCPLCSKSMLKKAVSHHPRLVVDVCPCGEGVWLDGPEVVLVNEHLFQDEEDEIAAPTVYAALPKCRSVIYDLHDIVQNVKK
jgi:Zn-finger nucleic acid-binding protein